MDDFLGDMMDVGAARGGWRSGWAILGLVLGAGTGGYVGSVSGGVGVLGGAATGAIVGWIAFILLTGVLRMIAIFTVILIAVLGWYWMTGRLG